MVNKCLLSLLVLISITNLFGIDATVTSCYEGYANKPVISNFPCPKTANFGCYAFNQGKNAQYGCIAQNQCDNPNTLCCYTNNCNNPLRVLFSIGNS